MITAGPTREPIDPVRFISNYSTGKMGIALADACARYGAAVTLVHGPINVQPASTITALPVQTAAEMYAAVRSRFNTCDIAIFAAAVADYTPQHPAAQKIKKNEASFSIELVKTKDIALEMGKLKQHQYTVGFALETTNELAHARQKLEKKNLDMIVLNSLRDAGAGFQTDTNRITILAPGGLQENYDLKPKELVAEDILTFIVEHYGERNAGN